MLDGRYLDIDLLGKIEGVKPVRDSTSAVHVFGITLERCPAEFSLVPEAAGQHLLQRRSPRDGRRGQGHRAVPDDALVADHRRVRDAGARRERRPGLRGRRRRAPARDRA